MADAVDLVVSSDQDEAIFAGWEAGKGLRTLARTFGVTVAEVERALDRMLPVFECAVATSRFQAGASSLGGPQQ
jgi:hypothetical protein